MKIYKYLFAFVALFFIIQTIDAQKKSRFPAKDKLEFGLFLGASNYSGDLSANGVNLNSTLLAYGGFARYNITNNLSLRFGLDWGTISDADANYGGSTWRKRRNLSFTTSLFGGYLAAEYDLAHWDLGAGKFISPYLHAGIGTFHFNPRAQYKGIWYDLRPLGTEGQGTLEYPDRHPYDPNQVYIPLGAGFRVNIAPKWSLAVEMRVAKTFTDYLDDVSTTYASPDVLKVQNGDIAVALANRSNEIYPTYPDQTGAKRGSSNNLDWFFYTGFTISHSFKPKARCYSF